MNYESGIMENPPPQEMGRRWRRGRIFALIVILLSLTLWFTKETATPTVSPPHEGETERGSSESTITTLLAVGDILLSRNVSAKIEKANDPNLPFSKLQNFLTSADITFGNLECPLDPGEKRIYEGLVFRCLTSDAEGLVNSGFDVLSTANNHSFDQGIDNLEFTIDYLKSRNILPVGTAKSHPRLASPLNSDVTSRVKGEEINTNSPPSVGEIPNDSSPPLVGGVRGGAILERGGIKFGFLAYSYSARNDGDKSTHPQIATIPPPSPPFQGGGGEGVIKSEISNLKSHGADVIIVSMHAGIEYTRQPNQQQIDFARAAIDAGADVVIGHHPHWIQPIEVYSPTIQLSPDEGRVPRAESRGRGVRKGLIFYSLGNFVFDQMWSQETREGLMVELEFRGRQLEQAKLIPIIIDNYCCPRQATEKEKTAILKKINLESDEVEF